MKQIEEAEAHIRAACVAAAEHGVRIVQGSWVYVDVEDSKLCACGLGVVVLQANNWCFDAVREGDCFDARASELLNLSPDEVDMFTSGFDGERGPRRDNALRPWWDLGLRIRQEFYKEGEM